MTLALERASGVDSGLAVRSLHAHGNTEYLDPKRCNRLHYYRCMLALRDQHEAGWQEDLLAGGVTVPGYRDRVSSFPNAEAHRVEFPLFILIATSNLTDTQCPQSHHPPIPHIAQSRTPRLPTRPLSELPTNALLLSSHLPLCPLPR